MTPKKIILHCSATEDGAVADFDAIRRYHKEKMGWSDIAYHYVIERVDGEYKVIVGRPRSVAGAHCKNHNRDSIGICLVGNFDFEAPPDEQWRAALVLAEWLCLTYDIPPSRVYGHREFTSLKTCPGSQFNLGKFRDDLRSSLYGG